MKRFATAVAFVLLFAIGSIAAAAMAGKSPAALLTTHDTTGTTGTTGTTTAPTTTTTPTVTTPRPAKVVLCHHTKSRKNPHVTISVSQSAVAAHLRHGDTAGACPSTTNVAKHSNAAHVKKFHKNATLRAELRAEAKARGKGKGRGRR